MRLESASRYFWRAGRGVCRFNFPTGREKPATRYYRLLREDPARIRGDVASRLKFIPAPTSTKTHRTQDITLRKTKQRDPPSHYHRRRVSVASPRVPVAPASPTYYARNVHVRTHARTRENLRAYAEVGSSATMRGRQRTPPIGARLMRWKM